MFSTVRRLKMVSTSSCFCFRSHLTGVWEDPEWADAVGEYGIQWDNREPPFRGQYLDESAA
jgi:hypothetical protein